MSNRCHLVVCEKPSEFGKFSLVDKRSVRHDFCSAWHRTLFIWLDMPPPERQKPFVNRGTTDDIMSLLKSAEPPNNNST